MFLVSPLFLHGQMSGVIIRTYEVKWVVWYVVSDVMVGQTPSSAFVSAVVCELSK